jgi:hypothetical protein
VNPIGTNRRIRAESQQIVAARPLYCLQYPIRNKSSAKDLPQRTNGIAKRYATGPKPILSRVTISGTDGIAPSMASDLEAFSH